MGASMRIYQNKLTYIGRAIVLLIIGLNLLALVMGLLNSGFNPDEFQHAHIAWNMVQGKVIYRDFFEHHGPLYAFINQGLLLFYKDAPAFSALFVLRAVSLCFSLLTLCCVYAFAKRMYPKLHDAGLLAVAFSSSYSFYHAKAFEIRPDPLQNLFWVLGLYVVYLATIERRWRLLWISGLCFGLMLLSNLKTLPGIAGTVLYLLFTVRWPLKNKRWFDLGQRLLPLGLGIVVALLPFSIYFYFNNSFEQFIFYNTLFNFMGMGVQSDQWPGNFRFLLYQQTSLFFLFVFGYSRALFRLWHKQVSLHERRATQLLALVTPLVMIGAWLGFYTHYYIIFLPLFGLIAVGAFQRIVVYCRQRFHPFIAMSTILLSLVVVVPIINIFTYVPFKPSEFLVQQRQQSEYILKKYSRSEKFLYTWGVGSAHVFNADVMYFWTSTGDFNLLYKKLTGRDIFGDDLLSVLIRERPAVITGSRFYLERAFSPTVYAYMLENYLKHPLLWNIWELKK